MACKNCQDQCKWNVRHICRVCELVDKDVSIKLVCYCSECKAYICKGCWPDLIRRAEAFAKSVVEKVVEVLKPKRKRKTNITEEFNSEDNAA